MQMLNTMIFNDIKLIHSNINFPLIGKLIIFKVSVYLPDF